jgi:hypothetical protein
VPQAALACFETNGPTTPGMSLAPGIIQRVRSEAQDDAERMLGILLTFSADFPATDTRVLRCLVFLSRGKLDALLAQVETARQDWRDTILAAEYEPTPGMKPFEGDYVRVRDFSQPFA